MEGMQDIGEVLRTARERQGRTIEEAYRATHITTRYLTALENGAFEVIPGEVYLKGFLRRYAQFLGIDGEELVQRYRDRREPKPDVPESRPALEEKGGRPPLGRRSLAFGALALVVAGVVLGAVLAWSAWSGRQPRREVLQGTAWGEPKAKTTTTPVPGDTATLSVAEPGTAADAGSKASATAAQPATDAPAAPVRVGVTVSERCWFRVVADGRLVYEGTLADGQEMSWTAQERLSVRFGNPGGVKVVWNGQPVQLDTQDPVTWLFLPKTIVGPHQAPVPAQVAPEPASGAAALPASAGQNAAKQAGEAPSPSSP